MKNKLIYQRTEFDCGTTSMINAISYLFDREEIKPEIIKAIYNYTLDEYDQNGNAYHGGTSMEIMRYLANWLNGYASSTNYPINAQCIYGTKISPTPNSLLYKWINDGGVAVARMHFGSYGHYVTITKIDNEYVYLFDPYAQEEKEDWEDGISVIKDRPYQFNRKVKIENQDQRDYYSFGDTDFCNIILLKKL